MLSPQRENFPQVLFYIIYCFKLKIILIIRIYSYIIYILYKKLIHIKNICTIYEMVLNYLSKMMVNYHVTKIKLN